MTDLGLGVELRLMRDRAGMTQQEAGDHARVSASFISQVEAGRKAPSEEVLLALLDAYKVPTDRRAMMLARLQGPAPPMAVYAMQPWESAPNTSDRPSGRRRRYEPRVIDLRPEQGRVWVAEHDVIERDGELYVSPLARVSLEPLDDAGIEVQRDETGVVHVKAPTRRPFSGHAWNPELLRAVRVQRLPAEDPDWRSYARTTITVVTPFGRAVGCRHLDGEADPTTFPTWKELGVAIEGCPAQLAVLTAWNAGWQVLDERTNAERNDLLHRLLRQPDLQVWPATMEGGGVAEEGFALAALPDRTEGPLEEVIQAARHFRQESIFLWRPHGRVVVPTAAPFEGWWHGWARADGPTTE